MQINTGNDVLTLSAVESVPNWVIGSFAHGSGELVPFRGDAVHIDRVSGAFTVFASDGGYVSVETQDAPSDGGLAGAEWGCATWSPDELDSTCGPDDPRYLDLNGTGGLSERFRYGHGAINLSICGSYLCMDTQSGSGYLENYWERISP